VFFVGGIKLSVKNCVWFSIYFVLSSAQVKTEAEPHHRRGGGGGKAWVWTRRRRCVPWSVEVDEVEPGRATEKEEREMRDEAPIDLPRGRG
jgi:hypothetical protein